MDLLGAPITSVFACESTLTLYPKFAPTKYYDTTYTTPIYVIQGHDGSVIPAFGDYRDDLLLELYNNHTDNLFEIILIKPF